MLNERGIHSRNSGSSSSSCGSPCSGTGSRSVRHRSSAMTSPQAGWSGSEAMWSTTRASTAWPIARITSGGSSRFAGSSGGTIMGVTLVGLGRSRVGGVDRPLYGGPGATETW